nr:uncharacterized protein DDB_G0287625-like [Leptinotarsa decemlineata]
MKYLTSAEVFVFVLQKATALQCWSCSSDIDPQCRDTFNQSEILSRRSGDSLYNNLQQNYDRQRNDPNYYNQGQYNPNLNNQRQYDPNFNNQRQFDPNFNRGQVPFNQNFNPNFINGRSPRLEVCDENEARNRRMKNVCLKEVVKGNNYVSIVRRCELIPLEASVGTCQQNVNKGLYLGFCEYCDYDGCNSATGLRTNLFLAAVATSVLMFLRY